MWNTGVSGEFRYFGSPAAEHAAAEADHVPARIADREHDAVPKAVVAAALLVTDHEARLDELLDLVPAVAEGAQDRIPGVGGVADAEAGRGRAVDAAALEVLDGGRRFAQRAAVELIGLAQHGQHRGLGGRRLLRARLARDLEPDDVRERFGGLGKLRLS